jgi:hypothetical protein
MCHFMRLIWLESSQLCTSHLGELVQHDAYNAPQTPRVLLPDLEAIKRVMNEKHQASLKAKAKEASSTSTSPKRNLRSILHLGT